MLGFLIAEESFLQFVEESGCALQRYQEPLQQSIHAITLGSPRIHIIELWRSGQRLDSVESRKIAPSPRPRGQHLTRYSIVFCSDEHRPCDESARFDHEASLNRESAQCPADRRPHRVSLQER